MPRETKEQRIVRMTEIERPLWESGVFPGGVDEAGRGGGGAGGRRVRRDAAPNRCCSTSTTAKRYRKKSERCSLTKSIKLR